MGLYQEFAQDMPARANPPGQAMSEQLRFLFWLADKRGWHRSGVKSNPPRSGSVEALESYSDLEEIEQAGEDMALEGYDLQAFVSNAASWF